MIVTPRFVFLHLHKSGGTFINDFLMRHIAGARQVGYHLPRTLTPPDAAALPAFAFVRSPWSYYVSWYSFQSSRPQGNALFRTLSGAGPPSFARTIGNMLRLGSDDELLDAVLNALPGTYTQQGLNLPAFALEPIRGSGLGFYSYLYRYLLGPDTRQVRIGRMEKLRSELIAILSELAQPLDATATEYIAGADALNRSEHAAVRDYYDDPLAGLVASRDAIVIDRHGYTFE